MCVTEWLNSFFSVFFRHFSSLIYLRSQISSSTIELPRSTRTRERDREETRNHDKFDIFVYGKTAVARSSLQVIVTLHQVQVKELLILCILARFSSLKWWTDELIQERTQKCSHLSSFANSSSENFLAITWIRIRTKHTHSHAKQMKKKLTTPEYELMSNHRWRLVLYSSVSLKRPIPIQRSLNCRRSRNHNRIPIQLDGSGIYNSQINQLWSMTLVVDFTQPLFHCSASSFRNTQKSPK